SFLTHSPTATFYTLSLHDALPISFLIELVRPESVSVVRPESTFVVMSCNRPDIVRYAEAPPRVFPDSRERMTAFSRSRSASRSRSEEHTSELQSLAYLVCRLLLEK